MSYSNIDLDTQLLSAFPDGSLGIDGRHLSGRTSLYYFKCVISKDVLRTCARKNFSKLSQVEWGADLTDHDVLQFCLHNMGDTEKVLSFSASRQTPDFFNQLLLLTGREHNGGHDSEAVRGSPTATR